jgi:cytochrome c oxidase subunit 1
MGEMANPSGYELNRHEARLAMAHFYVAFLALFLGGIAGLLQGLVRGGVIVLPGGISYYQLLTAHGVLLALVLTTYFIIGFLFVGVAKTTGGLSPVAKRLGWSGFWLMTIGTALTTVMILLNEGTVLYTFYAPMKASPWFYIGLTLVVVGSWLSGIGIFANYAKWKKAHRGKLSPLFAFMAVATYILWFVATIGVAVEALFMLIPWSFGWLDTINVMLSRTLFWYFGHPLVYFWLLPVYMAWYLSIPKLLGTKVFSDSLARMAFVLFIIFSIPVGFHHQLLEPGIEPGWKFLQVILTLAVVVPSLMTAFAMFATFETAGRAKGAKGVFGWVRTLPWRDARFLAPFVGMLFFVPAGAGGIVNASFQLNQVVHNTLWVTGHFHLTVATTVLLTFFGVGYWLIPYLTKRAFTPAMNRLAIIQTVVWTIGMLIMSGMMHLTGLLGVPRRTAFTDYQGMAADWIPMQAVMAIGGAILFIGIILELVIVINLMFFAPKGEPQFQLAEVSDEAVDTPPILERWGIWVAITAVLVVVAYTVPIIDMIQNAPPGSPPIRTW